MKTQTIPESDSPYVYGVYFPLTDTGEPVGEHIEWID